MSEPTVGAVAPGPPRGPSYEDPEPMPRVSQPGTNGLAIASLVLGLLGAIGLSAILSVIFGVIALKQIKKTGQAGRKLAIGGLVASGIWLVVVLLALNGTFSAGEPQAGETAMGLEGGSPLSLEEGNCYDRQSAAGAEEPVVRLMDCAQSHDGEVFAKMPLHAEKYAGTELVRQTAAYGCTAAASRYFSLDRGYPPYRQRSFFPQEQSWEKNVRWYICTAEGTYSPTTKTIQENSVAYSPEQMRYLRAAKGYDEQIAKFIETDGFAARRALAAEMVTIVDNFQYTLEEGPWSASVQPKADALARYKRLEGGIWRGAAEAADETRLDDGLDAADKLSGKAEEKAVREALALPTS